MASKSEEDSHSDYHEASQTGTSRSSSRHNSSAPHSVPWWQTQPGKIGLIGAGVVLVLFLTRKAFGGHGAASYSYAEVCIDNLMRGVSASCGAAIFGYDCDGTLDCQVAHNNIYCAKCGCDNNLVGKLFEDLPEECESYFQDEN